MKCRSIDAQAENIGGAGFCPNSAAAAVLLFMLLKYTAAFSNQPSDVLHLDASLVRHADW